MINLRSVVIHYGLSIFNPKIGTYNYSNFRFLKE